MKKFSVALMLIGLAAARVGAQEQSGLVFAMPAVSGPDPSMALIRRTEVQNHLRLTLPQKQALAEMLNDPSRAGVRFSVRSEGPPDQKQMEEDLRKQFEAHQKGVNDQLAKILRPEQMTRLIELGLQWRGSMALNDPKIAEKIGLNGEQRTQIARIVAEYQLEKARVMQALTQKSEENSPDGSAKRVMMRLNMSELDNPLSPARKALEAARDRAEKQIMSLLTDRQRESWKQAQGEPFTFKADRQATRF